MMDILDKIFQGINGPYHDLYFTFGFIAIGMTLFYVIPPILNKLTAPYRRVTLGDAVVSGNLVVYSGQMSGKVTYKGNQNTRLELTNTKIETLNAETGTVVKTRVIYDDPYDILLIAQGMIWTRFKQWSHIDRVRPFQANILDLNTLATRYDNKGIGQYFQFKDNERLANMHLDDGGTYIVFGSNTGNTYNFASDGEGYVQATATLSESSFDVDDWPAPLKVNNIKPNSQRYFICLGDHKIGTESFFEPIWVNGFSDEGWIDTGIVFVHPQTIDPCPFVSLTLLGVDGKIWWTVTQQSIGIENSTSRDELARFAYCGAYKNLIVYRVEAQKGPHKIIALNNKDGAIVWTKTFAIPN